MNMFNVVLIYFQPCNAGNGQENKTPIELSGYRIIYFGLLQQSLQSCQQCKSGKEPTTFLISF